MLTNITDIQKYIREWADDNFPNRTAYGAMQKLVFEEIPELVMSYRKEGRIDPGEIADVIILALDIASLEGYDASGIIDNKMKINKRRKWALNPDGQTMSHVKEQQ